MSRQITQSNDAVSRITLDSLSKFALADLVVDLIRRCEGDETLDGEPLAKAIVEAFEPIASRRGDRVPNVASIKKKVEETARIAELIREIQTPCSNCRTVARVTAEERGRGRWTCYSCGTINHWTK